MSTAALPPYTQEISRATPACFVFLLDQSLSMEEPIGGSGPRKCDQLADAINGWLNNMIVRAMGGSGVKDYMDVAAIGYHTDDAGNPIIGTAFGGSLAEPSQQNFVKISEIYANPLRLADKMQQMFDQDTGEMQEFPVQVTEWLDPVMQGGTPMCHAMHHTYGLLERWISEHHDSFPPIVIHITDGEAMDGDATPYAEAIRSLATDNGNVLVFNCHLSMQAADPIRFPHSAEMLPNQFARDLFKMSSELPAPIFEKAAMDGFPLQPNARGFMFNADAVSLLQFLDMGTRVAKQLR